MRSLDQGSSFGATYLRPISCEFVLRATPKFIYTQSMQIVSVAHWSGCNIQLQEAQTIALFI